jgi:hypothetical protein
MPRGVVGSLGPWLAQLAQKIEAQKHNS